MKTILVYVLHLVLAAVLLSGCSSTQVLETWHSSTVTADNQYKKLLIVNLNLDENVRKMYENVVTGEMTDKKIVAVASHKYLPFKEKYNMEDAKSAVRESGCDAVLTIRGLTSGNQQLSQQGQGSVLYGEGFIPSSWDDVKIAKLQLSLYHVETKQLVWSATVKATNDDNKFIQSRDLGKLLIKLLRQDGMVQ
jgi:uncharacterized protein YcfL